MGSVACWGTLDGKLSLCVTEPCPWLQCCSVFKSSQAPINSLMHFNQKVQNWYLEKWWQGVVLYYGLIELRTELNV